MSTITISLQSGLLFLGIAVVLALLIGFAIGIAVNLRDSYWKGYKDGFDQTCSPNQRWL